MPPSTCCGPASDLLHAATDRPARLHRLRPARGRASPSRSLACPELTELELSQHRRRAGPRTGRAEATLAATWRPAGTVWSAAGDRPRPPTTAWPVPTTWRPSAALLGYDRVQPGRGVLRDPPGPDVSCASTPRSVRSAVLDSIVPVEIDLWTNLAPEAQGAFEQLFEGCASDRGLRRRQSGPGDPVLRPGSTSSTPSRSRSSSAICSSGDSVRRGGRRRRACIGHGLPGPVRPVARSRSFRPWSAEVEAGRLPGTVEYLGSIQLTNLPYCGHRACSCRSSATRRSPSNRRPIWWPTPRPTPATAGWASSTARPPCSTCAGPGPPAQPPTSRPSPSSATCPPCSWPGPTTPSPDRATPMSVKLRNL